MTRLFGFILLGCLFLHSAGGQDHASPPEPKWPQEIQTHVADALEKIQASKIKLILYSLDSNDPRNLELPDGSAAAVFQGYTILGCTEIAPAEEKVRLLGSFAKGVRESNWGAWCFNPRHGIRIISGTSTNDFVICFECHQVQAYNFDAAGSFSTSSSPSKVFNQFLDEYHIKKAE